MIKGHTDVCLDPSRGTARRPNTAADFVSQPTADRQLGKTFYMAEQGGEVAADAARADGKHPLSISPCREWFALLILCEVGDAQEAESEQTDTLGTLRPTPPDVS